MAPSSSNQAFLTRQRCFLFLVNYARTKPEDALKALPTLLNVGPDARFEDLDAC